MFAAVYGHGGMARLLLEAGARQVQAGKREPLFLAMMCNHEAVALMLSTDMEAKDTLVQSGTFLDIACKFRFVRLVEVLLERGDRKCTHEESVGNITDALHNLLKGSSCSGVQHDTKSMERVEKIVTMLFDHGAKADEEIRGCTARELMSSHPSFLLRYLATHTSTN
jgi:hypothetical protein